MLEIRNKLKIRRSAYRVDVKGSLKLTFDSRQRTRLRTQLASGEEVALALPRGEILRGGDLVVASDGRVIEVIAESEKVLHVTCASPEALTRAAYHLGNRHVPVEVGAGYLRIAADHVLEQMLRGLGATIAAMDAAFEPEAGAYGGGHGHDEADGGHPGVIHQYGDHAHDHDHKHGHDHKHDDKHDHKHDHDHDHKHDPAPVHVHDETCGHDHADGHEAAHEDAHEHAKDSGHDHGHAHGGGHKHKH